MIIARTARSPVAIALIPQQPELFTQEQPDRFWDLLGRFREIAQVQQRFQQNGNSVPVVIAAVTTYEVKLARSELERLRKLFL